MCHALANRPFVWRWPFTFSVFKFVFTKILGKLLFVMVLKATWEHWWSSLTQISLVEVQKNGLKLNHWGSSYIHNTGYFFFKLCLARLPEMAREIMRHVLKQTAKKKNIKDPDIHFPWWLSSLLSSLSSAFWLQSCNSIHKTFNWDSYLEKNCVG